MDDSNNKRSFEVIIVGAGISGIIAAQRYLEAHPKCRLTLLEKDHCVGGVFSTRRSYTEFWTQWTLGMAEYSNMPMERPPEKDCRSDCFKAKYTTQYLEKYVDQMQHSGRPLREKIQFGIQVRSIEKANDKWELSCIDARNGPVMFSAVRLMIANGENSLPNIPDLPGKKSFEGTIVHSENFGESNIISSKTAKCVAVIGAGKSAADMVYEAVKAGKTVSWVIRKTGTGPGFFAPIDMKTPYRNGLEAAQTRVMSSLQPSILNPDTLWGRFLHSTVFGAAIIKWLFSRLDAAVRKRADYRGRKNTQGFEKLEYNTDIFWQNGTGGALHHNDFWDLVAKYVSIYHEDVKMLGNKTLYLMDGTHIPCDVVLCGTGWKPGIEFFSTEYLVELGLPHQLKDEPDEMTLKWEKLLSEADENITKRFRILANPPAHPHKHIQTTPYRLYNGMAPLNDDTILFMNHITAGNKIFAAEAQAVWAVAYFDRSIVLPEIGEREKEIATWVAWCKRRYLSNGERGNFAAFDSVPYADKLLKEVGLTGHRKGWLRDFFEPFFPSDLGKAWKEYLERCEK